jgi:predicted RNA-binding protein
MCLSSVYLEQKAPESRVMEDASLVAESDGTVTVSSLFGEKKTFEGYIVSEANLLEHYVVLKKKGTPHGG